MTTPPDSQIDALAADTQAEPAVMTIALADGNTVEASAAEGQPRSFRDAWVLDGDVISIDMTLARDIHRSALRQARTPLFAPHDDRLRLLGRKALLGGLSNEEQAQAVQAEAACRTLRDITADPRLTSAQTPEELAALTVEVLTVV
jgi:hypothetical protein